MRHLAAGLACAFMAVGAAQAGPRVYSLDQCADQYVLALAPRGDIVALSPRAGLPDSYLRARAIGLPRRRAALEPILASRAQIAVRNWGGDLMLTQALRRRGVKVVEIGDASDFDGVAAAIRSVASALGQRARGEALVAHMRAELAVAAADRQGHAALYLTSGGFTAGPGSLIDAMLRAAGFRNLSNRPYFAPVPLERLVMDPPSALVLGYFDHASLANQGWAFGRHQVVQKALKRRTIARLQSAVLGCPAWFTADGALQLSRAAGGA